MKCSRCQGLVVQDQIFDPEGPFLHIAILRCLNCGGTTYLNKDQAEDRHPEPSNRPSTKAA